MSARGFVTPEGAAGWDIQRRYVHVVAVEVHGDQALVAMLTNDEPGRGHDRGDVLKPGIWPIDDEAD